MFDDMRPMSEAPADGTPILARIRPDLSESHPAYANGRPDAYAGRFVVVRHPGSPEYGYDHEWGLAGPFGHQFGGARVFEGWWPLPSSKGAE